MWMLIGAAFAAGTIATFTDWLFMGVLFHERYNIHPEVWRPGIREGKERAAILWSCVLDYVSAAALVALCALVHANTFEAALVVTFLAWAAGPLAVMIVNGLFIKFDTVLTLTHALGYLVRFLIAGAAASLALQHG